MKKENSIEYADYYKFKPNGDNLESNSTEEQIKDSIRDEVLKSITSSIDNYSAPKILGFMNAVDLFRKNLFTQKDAEYGSSWQTNGKLGAVTELKRKVDRFSNQFKNGSVFNLVKKGLDGESRIDLFIDLTNYCEMFLAISFFTIKDKKEFEIFLERIPSLKDFYSFDEKRKIIVEK